jgi:hypothetical protein
LLGTKYVIKQKKKLKIKNVKRYGQIIDGKNQSPKIFPTLFNNSNVEGKNITQLMFLFFINFFILN